MKHRSFDRSLRILPLLLAALLSSPWARAAESAPVMAANATSNGFPAGTAPESAKPRSYTVLRGDTLDRVIQKTLPGSPLKIEILRKAYLELNAQAFTGGDMSRLQAGAVLQVPDHVQLLRASILPLLDAAEASALPGEGKSGNGYGNGTAGERRSWVRFP